MCTSECIRNVQMMKCFSTLKTFENQFVISDLFFFITIYLAQKKT